MRPHARAIRSAARLLAGAVMLLAPTARAEFPTLEVAIQRARAHALVVAEASAELGVAHAQMAGARQSSLGNPYADIQVDRPFSNHGVAGRQVQALTFTYFPLDMFGQRGKRIEEADKLIGWRKIGLVHAEGIATGAVVAAYGELVVNVSRVAEAKEGEAAAREEAKYFEGRYEARDTTLYEKSIAEAEIARWVQSRAEAELRVATARAHFALLVGDADVDSPPPDASILPPPLRGAWTDAHMAQLTEKAPAVSRALAEKHYWEASIERYEREKIPPVSFEIIAGRGGMGETRLGAGAVITLPVTRRYQGEIARAEQGRVHAIHHAEIYRNLVATRLRAARDAVQFVNRALEELDKHGIPALESAVSTSMEGFRAGKIDLQRAMLARRDLAIARARRLDLLEAAWRAYADLAIFSGELP